MIKLLINAAKASCFAFAFTVLLSGCEGKGQLPIHEKNAENTQISTTGGTASAPSGTSGANGSGSPGN